MTEQEMEPLPRPGRDPVQLPFWDAASRGVIAFQRCSGCANAFLPGRLECPRCLSSDLGWEEGSGRARLISWIVYHRSYHPAFRHRIPYTVAVVELAEGPRLISNVVGIDDPEMLTIDQPLILKVEEDDGLAIPRFRPQSASADHPGSRP